MAMMHRCTKYWLLLFIVALPFSAWAQQTYTLEKNIPYYPDSISKKDPYIASQCVLDVYYPKSAKESAIKYAATIVWFHAGGLTFGAKDIPKGLLEKGFVVVSVEYRLSPKVTAPAYIEDAAAAVAWVYKNVSKYGGAENLVFLSGHSAGGYLTMMITLDKKYLAKYNLDADKVAGLIPLSGQAVTHYTIRAERGIKNTQATIDDMAPIYFVRPDAPPIFLITGDAEMELLGRYEENAYLLRMLKLAGHTKNRLCQLQGYDHGGMVEPGVPLLVKEVTEARKRILGLDK
jgi:acetyl esterase/lipase